jgi:ATP-dependent Clp protease ATP-binding subunit ClpA
MTSILETDDFAQRWSDLLIGQPEVIEAIVPHIKVFEAGLNPERRPAGIFLLIGPSGTGKTTAAETLAAILHGSERHYIRIDCSEYTEESAINRLIGAAPGFIGHKETPVAITQVKLAAVTSSQSELSIVLFDEIEKAAHSLEKVLLAVMDKGILGLSDNQKVNFENTIILLSSNVGSKQMQDAIEQRFGFSGSDVEASRLDDLGINAAKKRFRPEFLNRIDKIIPYKMLDRAGYEKILAIQIEEQNRLILRRLNLRSFTLKVTSEGANWILDKGVSQTYGARELKRVLNVNFYHPVAFLAAKNRIAPRSEVIFDATGAGPAIYVRDDIRKRRVA